MKAVQEKSLFGKMPDGREVYSYILRNDQGMKVRIINYGGIITSLEVPDRNGDPGDVVLGFDSLEEYLNPHPYFGAVVGRYGNRIANGRFVLDSVPYELAQNLGRHHLHGGREGFDKKIWKAEWLEQENGLRLEYVSPHLEEGYPGTLTLTVEYVVQEENCLIIRYRAVTDAPTVLNPTQHTYFNLNGVRQNVHQHVARFRAGEFLEVDEDMIPTGQRLATEGTPMDFSTPYAIGKRIDDEFTQLSRGGGYDHCYIVDREASMSVPAAEVYDPESGRVLSMFTSEPAFQFYTGNSMDDSLQGKGHNYGHRMGFCLETQHFPDSPNHPEFPSTRLNPDEEFYSETRYSFSTRSGNQ